MIKEEIVLLYNNLHTHRLTHPNTHRHTLGASNIYLKSELINYIYTTYMLNQMILIITRSAIIL